MQDVCAALSSMARCVCGHCDGVLCKVVGHIYRRIYKCCQWLCQWLFSGFGFWVCTRQVGGCYDGSGGGVVVVT